MKFSLHIISKKMVEHNRTKINLWTECICMATWSWPTTICCHFSKLWDWNSIKIVHYTSEYGRKSVWCSHLLTSSTCSSQLRVETEGKCILHLQNDVWNWWTQNATIICSIVASIWWIWPNTPDNCSWRESKSCYIVSWSGETLFSSNQLAVSFSLRTNGFSGMWKLFPACF